MSTPARPGRHARRVGGALLATLILAAIALIAPETAGAQDPPGAPAARLAGVEATPWVTRDGTWTLLLQVEGAPAGGEVRAVIRDRLADREAYDLALFGIVEGGRKAAIPPVALATAAPAEGGGRAVPLAVTLRAESPDRPGWKFLSEGLRPGVYPVEIEVVDGEGTTVASTVTFLTRVASGQEEGADRAPLLVAPVLQLRARPSVTPVGEAALPPGLLADGNALVDGLAVATDLPVTFAPQPETIEALARETDGAPLLDDLRRATRDGQVLDAPYVDVPLAAWVGAGLNDELARQRARGGAILSDQLGPVDSSTFLASTALTPAAVAELWNVGVRTVIFGADVVDPSFPTGAPFTLSAGEGRSLVAVAPDSGLTTTLALRNDPVLDQVGLAAGLALLAAGEETPRGVTLVAPPGWPGRAEELAGLAEVLLAPDAPVQATTVADLVARVPTGPEQTLPTVMLEDLGRQPAALRRARDRLVSYTSMTGADDATVARLDQHLLLSGAASLPPATRRRHIDTVLTAVDRGFSGIEAPPRQKITLTSSDGTVPLHFRSSFDHPVQVVVEIDAGSRIELPEGTSMLVTLDPGTTRIPVAVHARAPGDTVFDITVRTPDRALVLDEVRYTVRSTAISNIGLFLSVGAVAFLILWWARHWRRTRRDRRRTTARAAADALVQDGAEPPAATPDPAVR